MTYTKLIERLRELQCVIAKGGTTRLPDSEAVREAADAIEALQGDRDQLQRDFTYMKQQRDALQAKLEAAPKALEPHEDTKLLDYLQERQATVEILMDSQGISVPLFRIGGLHGSICADIRGAINEARGITKGTPT